MTRKESEFMGFDIKTIVMSSFIGFGIYLLLSLISAILVLKDILPLSCSEVISKVCFFASTLVCCAHVKQKGRGEAFLDCLASAVFMFGYALLLFLMYPGRKWDAAGVVTCIMLCVLSCLMMLVRKVKNGKVHKRKRSR